MTSHFPLVITRNYVQGAEKKHIYFVFTSQHRLLCVHLIIQIANKSFVNAAKIKYLGTAMQCSIFRIHMWYLTT